MTSVLNQKNRKKQKTYRTHEKTTDDTYTILLTSRAVLLFYKQVNSSNFGNNTERN